MSEELTSGLAATANESPADTQPATPDAAMDAVFDAPAEPTASSADPISPAPAIEPVAAIAPPQNVAKPDGAKGEPPPERWDSILANARSKARDETLAEHRDRLDIIDRLQQDFPGTLAQLIEEGAADPRFSEQITSRMAAFTAARGQAAKANTEPEADLQTSDGALVYSADQLRKWSQWNAKAAEEKMTAQFKPLQQLQQRFEQHQRVMRDTKEAESIAEDRGGVWRQMPHFDVHKDAILSRQATIYAELEAQGKRGERRFDPVNSPWDALAMAYREVVSTQAIPKLQSQQTEQLVAQAAHKRAGSSSDPAASAPGRPRKPRTEDEALEQVFGAA